MFNAVQSFANAVAAAAAGSSTTCGPTPIGNCDASLSGGSGNVFESSSVKGSIGALQAGAELER